MVVLPLILQQSRASTTMSTAISPTSSASSFGYKAIVITTAVTLTRLPLILNYIEFVGVAAVSSSLLLKLMSNSHYNCS